RAASAARRRRSTAPGLRYRRPSVLTLQPLPKIVLLRIGETLFTVGIVRRDEALQRGHELPRTHPVDFLRREAHHGAVSVDGGKSDLSVGKVGLSLPSRL